MKLLDRRDLLKYASVSGLASLATACLSQNAPPTSQASQTPATGGGTTPQQQTITLKAQTGFGTRDLFHEIGVDWGKKVEELSGGRIKVDTSPAGAIVGAFDIIDAVHSGTLDVGHGVPAYWFGKNKAMSLFGTGPSLGMEANMILGWIHYGGGQQLYDQLVQQTLRLNVQSYFHGPMFNQPLGWFRDQITSVDQFRGLKYRTVGMAIDIFTSFGTQVIATPGGEVVPSLERGVIDAAEFNNTSSDRALGLPDVRKVLMTGSYHQPAEFLEVLINKQKLDSMPADLKNIIKYATMAQSADMAWKFMDRNSKDLEEIKKANVRVFKTPRTVLDAQLRAWDTIIQRETAANADFKRIYDSQRAWAQRVVNFVNEVDFDRPDRVAFAHYFRS